MYPEKKVGPDLPWVKVPIFSGLSEAELTFPSQRAGMLGLGLMLFCHRALRPGIAWKNAPPALAFWSILMLVIKIRRPEENAPLAERGISFFTCYADFLTASGKRITWPRLSSGIHFRLSL